MYCINIITVCGHVKLCFLSEAIELLNFIIGEQFFALLHAAYKHVPCTSNSFEVWLLDEQYRAVKKNAK